MWAALFTAILDFIARLVSTQTHKTGEDAPANSAARDKLNARLDSWKQRNGAP